MADGSRSTDPQVRYANRFVLKAALVLAAQLLVNSMLAALFHGPSVVVGFLVNLAALWLLAHVLFDEVNGLVDERLAAAEP